MKNNQIWRFFASVQLAIVNFVALSLTSVIGTLIPQNRIASFYHDSYGTFIGQFFLVLDFDNMYESWWFMSLLGILALNLIVCSIDKFPLTQKKVKSNGLKLSLKKLESIKLSQEIPAKRDTDIKELLSKNNWQSKSGTTDNLKVHYAEKYPWSHYGVYIVHISILVIFLGAIIGNLAGFKGSVMIPELGFADKVYSTSDSSAIPLGFEIRCNNFELEYYDNGMPKTYRSSLTIFEDGKELKTTNIEVNKPLIHNGITFYQASYEGFQDFIIKITDLKTGEIKSLTAAYQEQVSWQEKNIQLGILNAMATDQQVNKMKLWYYGNIGDPQTIWFDNGETKTIESFGYKISIKQKFATGLQVSKDPGVWLVYLGFFLLMLGLYISFFFSHQKIWLLEKKDSFLLVGKSNKNITGFKIKFENLARTLKDQLSK
ncbi:MAG: cytochrome c biogenesis protein ResB [Desulfotalea sp.]